MTAKAIPIFKERLDVKLCDMFNKVLNEFQ